MNRAERIIKSVKARKKRKETKKIVAGLKKRFYRDMKHLREKYQKIRKRHHDNRL